MRDGIEYGNYRGNSKQKKVRGGDNSPLFGKTIQEGRGDEIVNSISKERRRSKHVSTNPYKD